MTKTSGEREFFGLIDRSGEKDKRPIQNKTVSLGVSLTIDLSLHQALRIITNYYAALEE